MVTLFSQEKISEIHDYNIAMEALDRGMIKGRIEGRNEERLANLKVIMETMSLSASQALDALRIAEEERPAYLELLSSP